MPDMGDIVKRECEGKCKTTTPHIYQGKWFDRSSGEDYTALQDSEVYQRLKDCEQYECKKCHHILLKKT